MCVVVFVVLAIVVFVLLMQPRSSGFTFNNSEYQYGNPNPRREFDYYDCIAGECGGNTYDYECLEKCHLKTYRKDMRAPDVKDMVCWWNSAPGDYYRCLDDVYADYRYP